MPESREQILTTKLVLKGTEKYCSKLRKIKEEVESLTIKIKSANEEMNKLNNSLREYAELSKKSGILKGRCGE